MALELVPYNDLYLEKSWQWLNDPEIRQLTRTESFTREGQRQWFEGLPVKSDYKIWGIQFSGEAIGACGLKNIREGEAEYWGYIGEKSYWSKGLGKYILQNVKQKALELGLKQLYLVVGKDNHRAQKLYLRIGFKPEAPVETNEAIIRMRWNL